jgi:CheY-like chemotaxis protein
MATCVIVDDSHQFRSAASHILQRGGITVVGTAANTAEALAAIDESQPDVALIDVRLGRESGFALAERISQTPRSPMIILVSANPAEDLEQNITRPFIIKTELSGSAIVEIMNDHAIMNEAVTAYA